MNITLVNGSPRKKDSNSLLLLKALEEEMPQNNCFWHSSSSINVDEFLKDISQSEVLVIAFPLYIDGIPSHLLNLLQIIEESAIQNKATVYAIANCGFYEGKQTHLALQMVEYFCQQSNLKWGYGIGIGAGEMLSSAPIKKGPNTSTGKALETLAQNINTCTSKGNVYVNPNFPRFLYKEMGHMLWRKQAKKNGLPTKALRTTYPTI